MNVVTNLEDKKCVPCEGGVEPFGKKEVKEYLAKVSGWKSEDGKKIEKEFEFEDFVEALAFVNKAGDVAEEEGHHPDIRLHSYNKVLVELSTHSIEGLSENDFIMAAKIDKLRE